MYYEEVLQILKQYLSGCSFRQGKNLRRKTDILYKSVYKSSEIKRSHVDMYTKKVNV